MSDTGMNICHTSSELSIEGRRVASWADANRTVPPPKKFVKIPHDILAKPELKDYSLRARVVSSDWVNGHYTVKLEAVRLNLG